MRLGRSAGFLGLIALVVGLAAWLWLFGGAGQVARWAAEEQRQVQGALAGALRAVRGGEPWALFGLLGLCFAYGFFHAAGPGHGKLVMGGYALGEDVPRRRLVALTLAGALGQSVTAVLMVGAGALVFGWGRTQMVGLADGSLAAMSAAAVGLVGLWLVWRGLRRWSRAAQIQDHSDHGHHHGHDHDHDHANCGHAHGPSAEQVAMATDWRSGLSVVLAVAIRPCTGALFVLILTFAMGIAWVGILGALVMGLGTAVLTVIVALGAAQLRVGLVDRLDGPSGARAMAIVETLAGAVVVILATQVVLRLM